MKTKLVTLAMTSKDITFYSAKTARAKAGKLVAPPQNDDGDQMAFGIATIVAGGNPLVTLSLVLGEQQIAMTLEPDELEFFCHKLADAALWQNEELRKKSGQAVH